MKNPIGDYAQHSYQGDNRPTVAYRYASPVDAPSAASAVAHGPFAQQRLLAVQLPDFGGFSAPRVRFAYDSPTGRVTTIAYPTPGNQNADGASVAWQIAYSSTAAPATEATVTAPWGHATTYLLEHGRTREVKQQLEVRNPDGTATQQASSTAFTYRPDGRLASVRHPDGGEDELLYADSLLAGVKLDRLSLPNVEKATRKAPEGARGTAIYADMWTAVEKRGIPAVDRSFERSIDRIIGRARERARRVGWIELWGENWGEEGAADRGDRTFCRVLSPLPPARSERLRTC